MNLYVAGGLMLALIGAGLGYGHVRYTAGRNDLLVEQQAAAAKVQKTAQAKVVAGDAGAGKAVQAGEVKQAQAAEKTTVTVQTITRYIHDHPAPVVCAMPAGDPVLRELAAAADRANAAARAVSGARALGPAASGTVGL